MFLQKTEIRKTNGKANVASTPFESLISVQEKDFQIVFTRTAQAPITRN